MWNTAAAVLHEFNQCSPRRSAKSGVLAAMVSRTMSLRKGRRGKSGWRRQQLPSQHKEKSRPPRVGRRTRHLNLIAHLVLHAAFRTMCSTLLATRAFMQSTLAISICAAPNSLRYPKYDTLILAEKPDHQRTACTNQLRLHILLQSPNSLVVHLFPPALTLAALGKRQGELRLHTKRPVSPAQARTSPSRYALQTLSMHRTVA